MLDEDKCWQAVVARDATPTFVYGVTTTGIFCRPGCASRTPLRTNVRFYASAEAAKADGLRACRRCRPEEAPMNVMSATIAEICRHIDAHATEALDLASLAAKAGYSPHHFHRAFKAAVGVTPKQYHQAARRRALKAGLRDATTATAAIYDAGYGSGSRVYEQADALLGCTPAQYRGGGAGLDIVYAPIQTALGLLLIAATERGLCFAEFGGDEATLVAKLRAELPAATLTRSTGDDDQLHAWGAALVEHLAGRAACPSLPLDIRGTAFQEQVWRFLQTVPAGTTPTYSDVAAGIGRPSAVRAVASACAANRIALLIPCHRVVRGDGSLGGYRWGIERKRALLAREAQRTLA